MTEPSQPAKLDGGPLELLFESDAAPVWRMPAELVELYGGELSLERSRVIANFVASVDGAAALEAPGESGAIVSGKNQADRFVMGLLRACADAVLVGAGTFRASPKALWRPGFIFPPAAAAFAAIRREHGQSPEPKLVLVTATGDLPPGPGLSEAWILTTPAGGERLENTHSSLGRVTALDDERLSPSAILTLLRQEGLELVLTEGGPSLMGELVRDDLVDELFLTVSPRLFGEAAQSGLVAGVELEGKELELVSARRHGSHLFLRYRCFGLA